MTNIEFYYSDLWQRTLQAVFESKQITDDAAIYFAGSKLSKLTDYGCEIIVPAFINYTLMMQHKGLIEDCLSEQLGGKKIPITIIQEADLASYLPVMDTTFFDKNLDINQTFSDFILGKSNAQAHIASLTVANNLGITYNPLFIYGNSGLGKTHLLNAIGNHVFSNFPKRKIGFISGQGFIDALAKARKDEKVDEFKSAFFDLDLLLVDDIQFIAGKTWTQEIFFSIFNSLVNNRKQICITADRTPDDIKGLEERIISRFNQGLNVNIESPEYETSIKILEAKIANNKTIKEHIDEEVLSFIATNFSKDVRSLEGAVTRLLFYYINFNVENEDHISLKLAQEAFKDQITENKNELSVVKIRKVVCDYYNISKQQITSANRVQNIAIPRQIAMYLCRKLLDAPYKEIGNEFGKRDHSTVISSCEKVEKLIKSDPSYLKAIQEIEKRIG